MSSPETRERAVTEGAVSARHLRRQALQQFQIDPPVDRQAIQLVDDPEQGLDRVGRDDVEGAGRSPEPLDVVTQDGGQAEHRPPRPDVRAAAAAADSRSSSPAVRASRCCAPPRLPRDQWLPSERGQIFLDQECLDSGVHHRSKGERRDEEGQQTPSRSPPARGSGRVRSATSWGALNRATGAP